MSETAIGQKVSRPQLQVAATGFLSLFSLVGLSFYGLPFFYDFMVTEFGWSRTTVTSGNAFGKIVVGPLFGFLAGWIILTADGVAEALSPMLVGYLRDQSKNYVNGFASLIGLAVIGAIAIAMLPRKTIVSTNPE